jgi:hypothetical protein
VFARNPVDERDERAVQAFAVMHLTNALAGLRLSRAQSATGYGRDMLESHIDQLTDMLSDLRGWYDSIEEAASNSRE